MWSRLLASVAATALLLVLTGHVRVAHGNCSVHLKDLSERPPLLLLPGGPLNVSGFVAPDGDHVLRLAANASLLLACPGSQNQLLFANQTTRMIQVNATCVSDSQLTARGRALDLRQVACLRHAERTAERDGTRRCGADARGQRVRVGFRLLTGFLELVASCFDDQLLAPIYSNYTLVRSIVGKRPGGERAIFRTGGLFGSVSPRRQYEQQNSTLDALLGPDANVTAVDSLTRGHLASRAGFVFWPQKRATFFYVNAAPQWKSINAGAWAQVERAARDLAAARGDLLIVTGVYGVATLNDSLRRPAELYLYANGTDRKMPVPALFWKVVYDPRTHEGVAVVGGNNPWAPLDEHPELHLCPDIRARLRWMPSSLQDIYCCEVDALRQRVVDLPALDVKGLLESARPSKRWRKSRTKGEGEPERAKTLEVGEVPSGWATLLDAESAYAKEKYIVANQE